MRTVPTSAGKEETAMSNPGWASRIDKRCPCTRDCSKQTFCVVFDDGIFLFDNGFVSVPKYDIYAMTVIGNIHDNPELLGGADNG